MCSASYLHEQDDQDDHCDIQYDDLDMLWSFCDRQTDTKINLFKDSDGSISIFGITYYSFTQRKGQP